MSSRTKTTTPPNRAARQLADTTGMAPAEVEQYILAAEEYISPELAARYLSYGTQITAQGIRMRMRDGSLPIGYTEGSRCYILPERLVKWKRGELGVDGEKLARELAEAFREFPDMLLGMLREATAKVV